MTAVLLCGVDDEEWARLPARIDVDLADPAVRLDDPEPALLWHEAFTWRATGDTAWRVSSREPAVPPEAFTSTREPQEAL